MNVRNVHERELGATAALAGALVDEPVRMWPSDRWPALTDSGVGFLGHEPLEHRAGEKRSYRITGPRGLDGWHGWDVEARGDRTVLRHTVEAHVTGGMRLGWPLVVRPMPDAIHEDILDEAERAVGGVPAGRSWSPWVRALRWGIGKSRRRS